MSYVVASDSIARRHKYFAFLLCCTFISGFLSGAFITSRNSSLFSQLMHSAATTAPTALGAYLQIAVSFSLTALISKTGRGHLFLILCFLQAFTFGITATAVSIYYASACWLILPLLLFTRTITLISLLWFWFRSISGRSHNVNRDFLFALCASVLAETLDLCLVSPFILRLFI